jgi:ABC-type microcin C transport system duplicated ATPase subunit YejF
MSALLKISDLTITLKEASSSRTLVDSVSLSIDQEEIVALVGASGGGKTSMGLAILRLLPAAMTVEKGNIFFEEKNLLDLSVCSIRGVRGKEIAMIFQESLSAFNPLFTIEDQIVEVLRTHLSLSAVTARNRTLELLDLVEVEDVKRVARAYPHELSGGLRQRAMIAQAIAAGPKLVIADEPTSNLDVTIQAKILELFRKLKRQMHLSILLITHDLGIVRVLSDRMFVLYQGRIVESGRSADVLRAAQHGFTQKLLNASTL